MKRHKARIVAVAALSVCVWMAAPSASAQSSFDRDVRGQAFLFASPVAMSQVGSAIFEFGGGYDWLVYEGLGVGGEVSVMGDGYSAIGTAGVNVSYHFVPSGPGLEPFVVGGLSFGSGPEAGLSGYTWATAGGGLNYWFDNGMAIRVEVRGRFDVQYDSHAVGVRVGVTF